MTSPGIGSCQNFGVVLEMYRSWFFISDRHGSIEKTIAIVFSNSISWCLHPSRLYESQKLDFRMRPNDMDNFLMIYFTTAKAYRRQDFEA